MAFRPDLLLYLWRWIWKNLTESDRSKSCLPYKPTKELRACNTQTWFTPHSWSLQKMKLCKKRDFHAESWGRQTCASTWEKEKEENLGSLLLRKKADTNLVPAKTLAAPSQEAVLGLHSYCVQRIRTFCECFAHQRNNSLSTSMWCKHPPWALANCSMLPRVCLY